MRTATQRRLARLLSALLLLCLPALLLLPAFAEDDGGMPFGNVGIELPEEPTVPYYEDPSTAPRSGVNYCDMGAYDFEKSIYLEYTVTGGRDFSKKRVHDGGAELWASPGDTIMISFSADTDWPFVIPWAKSDPSDPDFFDLYTFESYIVTYGSYTSSEILPEYADDATRWDSASAHQTSYLSPERKTVYDGGYSGSVSVSIPSDIAEHIFFPDNDNPPSVVMTVINTIHLKPLTSEHTSHESSLDVRFNLRIWLELEYEVPVTGVIQEETVYAPPESGEDAGTVINPDIAEGTQTHSTSPGGAVAVGVGGAAIAAGGAALLNGGDDKGGKQKKRSTYRMHINKGFGNVIKKGSPPCWVYARILETTPKGEERERPDLTKLIVPFSDDGVLTVENGGMTTNGYMAARVTAPKGTEGSSGRVSFQFQGPGGYYTEHVIFSLTEAKINFGQENLGLPAHYNKKVELYFTVSNMPENMQVSAEFPKDCKAPYSVQLLRDPKEPRLFCAVLQDTEPKDEAEPGTTRSYPLRVRAEAPVTGADGRTEREVVERDFQVLRIFMGLVLQLEGDAIGCYLNVKDGRREMASKRAGGSNLGLDLATPAIGLNPLGTMLSAGTDAALGSTLANDLRDEDLEVCVTKGTLLLLCWNEEAQEIQRVAVYPSPSYPDKNVSVTALRVENDTNSLIGDAESRHQDLVERLGITIFPTNELDEKTGGRVVKLCATKAGLDRPTRLRAEITVRAVWQKETYEVRKKVLLHSMPFRSYRNETERQQQLGFDERARKFLEKMRDQIWDRYMNRLSSLYYLAGRMVDGYDPNFGFDQKQLDRVSDYWLRFLHGQAQGKNGETYKVGIKDDLAACVAFVEGMRDNGGLIGRIALGVCTAGYSEVLFFGMELHDKMKEAVFACKGKEFGFWDGVVLGVKEYEKQVAMELLLGGAMKLGNYGFGRLTGVDLAATIGNNWRAAMNAADKALRGKSQLYKLGAKTLDGILAFTNGGAAAYKETMEKAAREEAALEAAAHEKATSIAQRRRGDLGLTPEQLRSLEIHDIAMERGMDDLRNLWNAEQTLAKARKAGNYEAALQAYEEAWLKVKYNKNAFKQLKYYTGPEGQTMRAKFTEVRQRHDRAILERVLDDVSAETGIPRNELYVETVSGHADAWKETAGLSLSEDLDMNVRQVVYSGRDGLVTAPNASYAAGSQDIIIAQKTGENAMMRNVYKEFHGGMEPPSLEAAREFAQRMDYTYVQPWQGLEGDMEISFNQEAYIELNKVIDPAHFGESLQAKRMNQLTVEHKSLEWKSRAEKHQAQAQTIEAEAELLTGEARAAKLEEALELRCVAHGEEVESVRQIVKAGENTIAPRSEFREGAGLGGSYTAEAKEIVAMGKEVQKGLDPHAYFDQLRTEQGMDYRQAVKKVASCLE